MTINQLFALAQAGFTVEQVAVMKQAISQSAAPQSISQNVAPVAPVAPVVPPGPVAQIPPVMPSYMEQYNQSVPNQTDSVLLNEIQSLKTALQANALAATNMPTEESIDDMLASVINPPVPYITEQNK